MAPSLNLPCLMLITDRSLCRDLADLERRVVAAVRGGVSIVQLRERDLPAGELLALGKRLRSLIEGQALLVVNDRLDVALASGADGVHLPEAGLAVSEARRLGGPGLLVGRSVHSVAAALESQAQQVDLLEVGTVFATPSKPGKDPEGPELLDEVGRRVFTPFVGVGGITLDNVARVMAAGASGAAIIRTVLAADNPEQAATRLRQAMEAAWLARQHGVGVKRP